MCQDAPDTLTHLLVICQHTDIQHARSELYKELRLLADLMTFEDAEVSRILKSLIYQLQVTWNRYEDTSKNHLHYGSDCRAWAGLIREEVLLEIKNSSSKQPGIPSNAIN